MARKRKNTKQNEIDNLRLALVQNGKAIENGAQRKHWSLHDLQVINPITPTQEEVFHEWFMMKNICMHGTAGTGKTFLALYLALNEVLRKEHNKVIIVRSIVATRDIGFLPGTLEEKMSAYEHAYDSILAELIGRNSTYSDMKEAGIIEFMTTSFLRGLTVDNAIIIVEECENMTFHEIDSIMTRVGKNTRVIVTGDVKQTDLYKKNDKEGMSTALRVFDNMPEFSYVEFNVNDIVRSDFVKSWIVSCEEINKCNNS